MNEALDWGKLIATIVSAGPIGWAVAGACLLIVGVLLIWFKVKYSQAVDNANEQQIIQDQAQGQTQNQTVEQAVNTAEQTNANSLQNDIDELNR
jgi:membrane protein implicated in regulation of membrane protease activity